MDGGDATQLWRCSLVVPRAAVDALLEALEDEALSVAAFEADERPDGEAERWRIETVHQGMPDRARLGALIEERAAGLGLSAAALELEPLRPADWLGAIAVGAPPVRAGRFFVHGSHVREAPPAGSVPIRIDAGLAFGSGDHASTRGCLLALDDLARRRLRRVLDLGTGSGVLAIAAAKCRPARVVACDHDPVAVMVAAENARLNGVANRVAVVVSEGLAAPAVRLGAPYDLILANLLADILIELAGGIARHLAPDGHAVLSGLLDRQEGAVLAAFRRRGLRLCRRIALGPWSTLVVARGRR